MNRRTIYTIGIAVILFFIFFNPFKKGSNTDVQRPYVPNDTQELLIDYVENNYKTPENYLVSMFQSRDIVFVGEMNQIKQQVETIENVIPLLYKNGITNLAVEIALSEDQAAIDSLLSSNSYDPKAVEKILFNRMVIWGFQEYADIFKKAWDLNRTLPEDSPPFRIIGLSVRQNWSMVESEKDMRDPEIVSQVFATGIPDVVMADVIRKEIINKDEKGLIFVSSQHAYTAFEAKEYTENAAESGLSDTRRGGNIIYDLIGNRSATVLMHGPWPYKKAQLLSVFPADGVFDKLIDDLPEDRQSVGLLVTSPELIDIRAGRSDYSYEYDGLKLSDMCDGYILLGPINEYEVVSPIADFITEDNIATTIANFPGAAPGDITVEEMNDYIASLTTNRKTFLAKFR
ncbi:MAG: hypothetical protein HN368_08110 [Spirochaetales bacterium]|jgi:hypothetical protein|nr:hypothetical protein [Spirochaetales bacterium]